MISRILVGLGGTDFTPIAIRYAVEIGAAHHAEIHGVTVTDRRSLFALSYNSGHDAVQEMTHLHNLEQRQDHYIESLREECKQADVRCLINRETGDPFELMMSQSRYHDLMIFGLRSLFEGDVIKTEPSDMLSRLVSRGVRPILAVAKRYRAIRRVLLAYSGSMESAKAIRRFIQLRLWPNVELKIVTFEHELKAAQTLLNDMTTYCRAHGYEPEVEYIPESARQTLLKCAEDWEADEIVVGNSARTLWMKKLFGETAMHAVRHSTIPLFLSQ